MTALAGPLVHLPLDELQGLRARDTGGSGLDATAVAATAPTVVADDLFGSVLQFDGVDDVMTLPAAAVPAGEELSVCLWALGAASLPRSTSVLWVADAAGARTFNVHLPWNNEVVFFDHGNSGGSFDRVEKTATPAEYKGSWAHWAFVRQAGGTMRIYRNGAVWASGTGKTRTRTAATLLQLGGPPQTPWAGKLAHLRIYTRAVSGAEIQQMIEDDRTARSAFRSSYPFDVYLHDGSDQEVLYITDAARAKPLYVEITNRSGLAAALNTPAAGTAAGPQGYHFALRFRPGTLAFAAPAAPASQLTDLQTALDAALPTGWSGKVARDPDGAAAIYFLHGAGTTLAAQDKLTFVLPQARADAGAGARGTRGELRFGQLALGGSETVVTGRRVAHLNVVNHQGEREIPLRAAIAGNAGVLNEGSANTLTLRLSTLLRAGQIDFKKTGSAPTHLVLSFDVDADTRRAWALGTSSQVSAVGVAAQAVQGGASTPWTVTPNTTSTTPEWIITPPADTALKPGEWLEITLSNLKTSHAAGEAAAYLRYDNVPGYWDGVLVAALGKGRLVQKDGGVGIGTASPTESLHTSGSVRVDGGSIKSRTGIALWPNADNTSPGTAWVRVLRHDDREILQVNTGGKVLIGAGGVAVNVGIGTTAPAESLHTTGHVRVDGGEIKSNSGITLRPDQGTGTGTALAHVRVMNRAGAEVLRVSTADTRVGIGTTAPAESLHTTGHVRVDGGEIKSNSGITLRPDVDNTGDGWFRVMRPDGVEMMKVGTWSVSVFGGTVSGVALNVNGIVTATNLKATDSISANVVSVLQKLFRIPHPLRPGRDLVHACLEGPENGVCYRGTARLVDGRATVRLPDYFEALTRPEGRTVQLTARGREPFALSHGGVAEGAFEAFGTKADGEFDWEVRAARADVAPLETDLPAG